LAPPEPPEISIPPQGLSAEELAERAHVLSRRRLDPDELEQWLLGAGLATSDGELLRPTPVAIDLAETLALATA
jgi:hypothetical protein